MSSVTYSLPSGPQAMAVGCSSPAANVETSKARRNDDPRDRRPGGGDDDRGDEDRDQANAGAQDHDASLHAVGLHRRPDRPARGPAGGSCASPCVRRDARSPHGREQARCRPPGGRSSSRAWPSSGPRRASVRAALRAARLRPELGTLARMANSSLPTRAMSSSGPSEVASRSARRRSASLPAVNPSSRLKSFSSIHVGDEERERPPGGEAPRDRRLEGSRIRQPGEHVALGEHAQLVDHRPITGCEPADERADGHVRDSAGDRARRQELVRGHVAG